MTTTTTAASATEASRASRPIYRLHNVSKTYKQKQRTVTALTNVDLEIPQGQLVAVQGPTGGGKSTLLQMLGALDRPTAGSVMLGEHDVAKLGDGALTDLRATEIGFVFQNFNLIPTLTALENVETAFAGRSRTARGPRCATVRRRRSGRSASANGSTTCRPSCPVGSSSASRSPERS